MTDARLLATNPENSSLVPVACNSAGQLIVTDVTIEALPNSLAVDGDLTVTGSADITGRMTSKDFLTSESNAYVSGSYESAGVPGGFFRGTAPSVTASGECLRFNRVGGGINDVVINMRYDGSAAFAGGKAGLTAEGNLWVTTARGQVVMLDAVSNGLGSWVPYEPTPIRTAPAPGA